MHCAAIEQVPYRSTPLLEKSAMTFPAGSQMTPKAGRKRPLALVVNDTQEILDLFRDILEEEEFEVVLTTFTPRDLDELVSVDPDIVILDFMIGNEAVGWQLLQKMKMHQATQGIPVVVCTGAVQLARELDGQLAAKNVGVVLKPFDIDDLLRMLRSTISLTGNTTGTVSAGEGATG
jgi:DNA-binding response OmpR family regulator